MGIEGASEPREPPSATAPRNCQRALVSTSRARERSHAVKTALFSLQGVEDDAVQRSASAST